MVDIVTRFPEVHSRRISNNTPGAVVRVPAAAGETTAASLPKLIGLAQQLAALGPPVDYARIAQIRQAIAQGGYRIDPDAVARAITAYGRLDRGQ